MGGAGVDLGGAAQLGEGLGRAAEGAGGVHHVVQEDDPLAPDVADDVHDLGGVGLLAALVHDGHVHAQLLGEGPGPGHGAHVGGDHHGALGVVGELPLEVLHEEGAAQEVVHGDVEKALDLGGVEVHGQHAVRAGGGEHVGHQLGGDGVTGLGLPVLPGVAEVGDDGGDAAGGGPLEGVDHHQKLHQVVVDRGAGGLDHKHVGAPDGLVDGDEAFPIGEGAALQVAQRQPELLADGLSQRPVGIAAEDLQVFSMCDHNTIPFFIPCAVKRMRKKNDV